jgi:hypothetical protein
MDFTAPGGGSSPASPVVTASAYTTVVHTIGEQTMSIGTISVRVRPLRIAFLVDPQDRRGVRSAIEMSTMQWGGAYNLLIPFYRRTPRLWASHRGVRLPHAEDILHGYLEGFDPDIVVPVGACAERAFSAGHRDVIKTEELLGDDPRSPSFGVGLFEVLDSFIEAELKFVRSDRLRLVFPKVPSALGLFFASVVGAFPSDVEPFLEPYLKEVPGTERPTATADSLAELLAPYNLFPRRLSSWKLEQPMFDPQLFICDARSSQDVIDYWNLRASGRYVIPVPVQAMESASMKTLARDFINENYQPRRNHPEWFHRATVQKSRTVNEDVVRLFCTSLELTRGQANKEPKFVLRTWHPRIWDEWARRNTDEGFSRPFSEQIDTAIPDGQPRMELRAHEPRFNWRKEYNGKPRFANDFSFRFIGAKEPMAEVLPSGSRELSTAIGRSGYHNWRFSETGPVFLASMGDDLIFLDLPRAEAVMTEWLRERGWSVQLSASGRMASLLVRQLDGVVGVGLLAHRGLSELFAALEKEGGMPRQAVIGRLKQTVDPARDHFHGDFYFKRLVEVGALRLGATIQCPICTRHNWYELDQLNYRVRCRFCISEFAAPVHSPNQMQWTYRAHGPFTSTAAQGAFTVLLVVKFLAGTYDRGVTPLFSYTAKKGSNVLETDLTCLYRASPWRTGKTDVVHAECKSANEFEKRDFDRMKFLSDEFPGCVLVFATLRESLSAPEISQLRSLVLWNRRRRLSRKTYSNIVVLTGVELQSDRSVPYCWRDKGGAYENVAKHWHGTGELASLSDATLQIHVGIPSWSEWYESRMHAKRRHNP